jgi:hypothetical protein
MLDRVLRALFDSILGKLFTLIKKFFGYSVSKVKDFFSKRLYKSRKKLSDKAKEKMLSDNDKDRMKGNELNEDFYNDFTD